MKINRVYRFFLLGVIISMSRATTCLEQKTLQRVAYTMQDPQAINIDLGTVRFYFDQKPVITVTQTGSNKETVFFFPLATVADEQVLEGIRHLNQVHNNLYQIHAERVKSGIKVSIKHDAQAVTVKHALFQSSNMQHGVVLSLYNQKLMKAIGKSERALLATF